MGSSTVAELVPPETTLFNGQILVEIPLDTKSFQYRLWKEERWVSKGSGRKAGVVNS